MLADLTGKIALVTGAASPQGIGFACAAMLAEQGAWVFLTDIDGAGVRDRAAELDAQGYRVGAAQHDVRSEESWADVMSGLVEQLGRLDILVNNAGLALPAALPQVSVVDWDAQIDVNLRGPMLGMRAAKLCFSRQQSQGVIVNIGSVAAAVGYAGNAAYCATKGGLRLLSKAAALEFAADGVRVNCVHPGLIETDIIKKSMERDPKLASQIVDSMNIPLRRMGQARDIAAAVVFLASDDARYITGADLLVDGGVTAQ